jgi:hypothetical protein
MHSAAISSAVGARVAAISATLRELAGLGFSRRPSIVRQWAGRRRKAEPRPAAPAKEARPPTRRQLARLLISECDLLGPTERAVVARVLTQMPGLINRLKMLERTIVC